MAHGEKPMQTSPISENALREIWLCQSFKTSDLRTSEGEPVHIIFPGKLNTDGGPDCTGARIRIGKILYFGDVELHVAGTSWHAHRHSNDPHYNRVILHVILSAGKHPPTSLTASKRRVPVLILDTYLAGTSRTNPEISPVTSSTSEPAPLPCRDKNEGASPTLIRNWLIALGRMRMELRIRIMRERLQELMEEFRGGVCDTRSPYHQGDREELPTPQHEFSRQEFAAREPWDQLLYENVMEGMGYAKNRRPFLSLARGLRLTALRRLGLSHIRLVQAALFGTAGLLPSVRSIREKESRAYVRALQKQWKELRPRLNIPLLHEGEWLFFRLRPSNFPTARLAAFCFILPVLFSRDALRLMIGSFTETGLAPAARLQRITSLFIFTPDSYWSHHLRFHAKARKSGVAVGRERIHDLVINTIIPFVLLYGRVFRDCEARSGALQLLDAMPPSRENVITRLVRRELLRGKIKLSSPLEQQGALQLYKRYCRNGRCTECDVGKAIGFTGGEQAEDEMRRLESGPP
jgi:hypothetical protein